MGHYGALRVGFIGSSSGGSVLRSISGPRDTSRDTSRDILAGPLSVYPKSFSCNLPRYLTIRFLPLGHRLSFCSSACEYCSYLQDHHIIIWYCKSEASANMAPLPLAQYPPPEIRNHITPKEWNLCIESWLLLTQRLLSLSSEGFSNSLQDLSVEQFLVSYVEHVSPNDDAETDKIKRLMLRKQCFLLVHRIFSSNDPIPAPLLDYSFLARLSTLYSKSRALKTLLEHVWTRESLENSIAFEKSKTSLCTLIETAREPSALYEHLLKAVAFAKALPLYGHYLLVGSDFIDAVSDAYNRLETPSINRKLIVLTYTCLASLMAPQNPKTSSLLDHLYSLQATPLMKAVVEITPFFTHLEKFLAKPGADSRRAKPLLRTLATYKRPANGRPRKPVRRRLNKGKQKAAAGAGPSVSHIHQMSLISQIQDLFPDLGSGFIVKLLDEYNDDAEQITAHLLDNNLPPRLRDANRSEQLPENSHESIPNNNDLVPHLAPHPTPPLLPTCHNIHDNDSFDRLAISASQIHLGPKNTDLTADKLLATSQPPSQKAAILSALAAFDSDDDERDDTYDVADVGGTVDTTFGDSDADLKQEKNEEALFAAYKTNTNVFSRDAETRRGRARAALKTETGMTDEAIEGWAVMAKRDPKRLQRMERLHEMSGGQQQRALAGSAWKADSGTEETEDSDIPGSGEPDRGGGRGRGRVVGGRGRGGSAGGPSHDPTTQIARQRKDTNKASRANHNRRDQRARKMARGGGIAG